MTQLYLVRHGEADYSPVTSRGWPGGASDLAPLTALGIEQAELAADALSGAGANYLLSSPMTRALQTAAIVGHRLALGVRVDFELREWLPDDTFGWTSHAEVKAAYAELLACGGEWPAGETRPWEPLSAVRARTLHALHRHSTATDGPIVVVTHALVIEALTGFVDTPPGGTRWHAIDPISDI